MTVYLSVFAVFFGLILGSFLNAITFRYNTGQPLFRAMQGRSRCMRCGHVLGALDLIPVVSWMFLRGRCRYCRSPISIQYPLVEVVAAFLSLGVYLLYPAPAPYAFWLLIWMITLFLVVYDWRHLILPIEGLLLLMAASLLPFFLPCLSDVASAEAARASCSIILPGIWQLLSGPLVALPLLFLSLISLGRWMGWGDGIFAVPLGWILGLRLAFGALILAFWVGAAVGIILLLVRQSGRIRGRGLTLRSEIPFGPFLALGMAIVFFTHFDLFRALGIG